MQTETKNGSLTTQQLISVQFHCKSTFNRLPYIYTWTSARIGPFRNLFLGSKSRSVGKAKSCACHHAKEISQQTMISVFSSGNWTFGTHSCLWLTCHVNGVWNLSWLSQQHNCIFIQYWWWLTNRVNCFKKSGKN